MDKRNFDNRDKDFIMRLMPHLANAFRIYTRYSGSLEEKHLAQHALQLMKTATILVDESGDVRFCNRAAESLLAATTAFIAGG